MHPDNLPRIRDKRHPRVPIRWEAGRRSKGDQTETLVSAVTLPNRVPDYRTSTSVFPTDSQPELPERIVSLTGTVSLTST